MEWLERPPPEPMTCSTCQRLASRLPGGAISLLQCLDHLHSQHRCLDCTLQAHRGTPFHNVQVWDAKLEHWRKVTTKELGYVEYLGHGGKPCEARNNVARTLTIVHERGIEDMDVLFCKCASAQEEPYQLIQARMWPATWKHPETATTLSALRMFDGLNHDANVNVHDYLKHLKNMTDATFAHEVKDRYREFNMSTRQFNHVRQTRRFGLRVDADMVESQKAGLMCVTCPACPDPAVNMRPGWRLRDEDYKFLDALHYSIDGNFHLGLKDNKADPEDVALSSGMGYFVNHKDLHAFLKKAPKLKPQKSTCNEFAAMGSGKYKGKVSGVVGISCRHMFMMPGGTVDLVKSEDRYRYVDFALVSCLQRYLQLLLLMGTYDIHCQYIKNLRTRLEREFGVVLEELDSIVSAELPEIRAGIGMFHAEAHKGDCRFKHSQFYLPGACRNDGEMLERIWAVTNALACRTKEMTAGHRHDVLNDRYSAMNVRRLHGMRKELCKKLEEAERKFKDCDDYIGVVEDTIQREDLVREWRVEHTHWCKKVVDLKQHRGLENPFEPAREAELTTQQIMDHLVADTVKDKDRAGAGLVGYIAQVLALEDERLELEGRLEVCDGTSEQQSSLREDVVAHVGRVAHAASEQKVYLDPCVESACDAVETDMQSAGFPWRDDDEERGIREGGTANADLVDMLAEAEVGLPSQFHADVRRQQPMRRAVEIELSLRQGIAHEALDDLRTHLMTHQQLSKRKNKPGGPADKSKDTNVPAGDRRLPQKVAAINASKARYRRNYALLELLGHREGPETNLQRLDDDDCKALVLYDSERQRGDSGRLPTWIWGDFSFVEAQPEGKIKEFLVHCLKAHWFRHKAQRDRWWEQVLYCREDMYRTVRSFKYYMDLWEGRAEKHQIGEAFGAACYARRQATRYRRMHKDAVLHFPSVISVVRHLL
ncbi:hypothetical protein C8Q78DRAFT_973243 [Trametes maxima]|nr:hypothetical protein C8Q78DRAFT_973243 [Trametes maxima]